MAAARQVQAHDARVRREESRVHGEVRRRAGVGLHVDAPLVRGQSVRLERAALAEVLDLVDDLVASVITLARQAPRQSMMALLAKFSDAMSSMDVNWRRCSWAMSSDISLSTSSRGLSPGWDLIIAAILLLRRPRSTSDSAQSASATMNVRGMAEMP